MEASSRDRVEHEDRSRGARAERAPAMEAENAELGGSRAREVRQRIGRFADQGFSPAGAAGDAPGPRRVVCGAATPSGRGGCRSSAPFVRVPPRRILCAGLRLDDLRAGGGAAATAALGMLLGNKRHKKMAGKVITYGGLAALGVLAYKAYGNWQQQQGNVGVTQPPQTVDRLPEPQVEQHSQAILRA